MTLGHIDRGTKMSIFEDVQLRTENDGYEAVFRYIENDTLFVVQCHRLYDIFDKLEPDEHLGISFTVGADICTFTGRAVEKLRGAGMVMIEQLSGIKTLNRRQFVRDELHCNVNVYGIPESALSEHRTSPPENQPDLSDITFDISSGGLCVISQHLLKSEHDPYYLLEFSLSEKDRFLLPAKLVRRSLYHRTSIGKYDYGFQFVFDAVPDEKGRLTTSILTKKLSYQKSR